MTLPELPDPNWTEVQRIKATWEKRRQHPFYNGSNLQNRDIEYLLSWIYREGVE